MRSATPYTKALGLVAVVTAAAVAVGAATAQDSWHQVSARPGICAGLLLLTLALQAGGIDGSRTGPVSFVNVGLIALGILAGPATAIVAGALAATVRLIVARGLLHRALFDAANLGLSAAAAAAFYRAAASASWTGAAQAATAAGAGLLFFLINTSLLSLAIATSADAPSPLAIWRERYRWMAPLATIAGLLSLAAVSTYHALGTTALVVIAAAATAAAVALQQVASRADNLRQTELG